ncbi:hypothetical protein DB30_04728 [Enhygromyxa salina]|uniref:DUF2330 domain-containing protein n=1 Tax=Enhygromyxa salina TaxID=215803 RepID=A0A0C1ZYH9_9BACT|nr:hypothetical protein DB30_04728 [Enhygromyxa salina]
MAATLTGAALAFAAPLLTPTTALACGGTFCDSGPTAMPVDQTGENILFHVSDTSVEAHIQIQYNPDSGAEQFAWVIPVMAIPEFAVGSQLMFDAVLAASVPSYGLSVQTDFCGDPDDPQSAGEDGAPDGDGLSSGTGGDDEGNGGGPSIVLQTTVGAFDISVLEGGTVQSVMQWLGDNGYQQDPAAEPILAEYLANDYLFVALKLNNQAGVDEIHPIVIRYDGVEPCVPIRLTRIAAIDDMEIRAFFLQDARVVPTNYRHVLVNPLKLDWVNNGSNYKEVISMAVDAQEANGNAFVTEYAGTSQNIQTWMIYQDWVSDPFLDLVDSPIGAIEALENQGLMLCDTDWDTKCTYMHPLLESIVTEFIPAPEGVEANLFYDCLSCYVDQIDLAAWDAAGFAARLDERVIAPAKAAVALIENNPYLTRLYTTISPAEMNEDPIFRVNTTLPDVPNINFATQTNHCDGSATVLLPDGREVLFPDSGNIVWPDFADEMPWEEDIDQENMADNAPLLNLVDNTDRINELLAAHNASTKAQITGLGNSGCGCAIQTDDAPGKIALGLACLGLLGFVRRRRWA